MLPNGTVKMYEGLKHPLKVSLTNAGLSPPRAYYGSSRGKQAEMEELAHIQHV